MHLPNQCPPEGGRAVPAEYIVPTPDRVNLRGKEKAGGRALTLPVRRADHALLDISGVAFALPSAVRRLEPALESILNYIVAITKCTAEGKTRREIR